LDHIKTKMARAPQDWHSETPEVFFRASTAETDFAQWEIRESAKGPQVWTPRGQGVSLTAETLVRQAPARWNDDPRTSYTLGLDATPALVSFVRQLEDWALPRIAGREEPHSAIKTNPFAETFLRAKLTPITRWFDKSGRQLAEMPDLAVGARVCVLLALVPYKMNGLKGFSVKLLALQPM
jgi:hypothetical protein